MEFKLILRSGYTEVVTNDHSIRIVVKPNYIKIIITLFLYAILTLASISTSTGWVLFFQLMFVLIVTLYICFKLIRSFVLYPIIFDHYGVTFKTYNWFKIDKIELSQTQIKNIGLDRTQNDYFHLTVLKDSKKLDLCFFLPSVEENRLIEMVNQLKKLGFLVHLSI